MYIFRVFLCVFSSFFGNVSETCRHSMPRARLLLTRAFVVTFALTFAVSHEFVHAHVDARVDANCRANARTMAATGARAGGDASADARGVRARSLARVDASVLAFGASALAGIYDALPPEKANDAVAKAIEVGMRAFDTAPHYGLGLSERRLGDGVRFAFDGDRARANEETRVYTKVGRVIKPESEVSEEEKEKYVEWGNVPGREGCIFPEATRDALPVLDYSAAGFERSHADSLKRLGLDRVVGLRIHDAETPERFEAAMSGGGVEALVRMRERGDIDEVSIGMNDPSYVLRMIRESAPGTFDSVMLAGSWNLIDQDGYEVLLECQERNISVHNAGVFASGVLVGGSNYKYAPAPEEIKSRVARWRSLADAYDVPLPAVALAFALAPAVVDLCAVGFKSPDEVEQSVAWLAAARDVPPDLWRDAKAQGLLLSHVPVPLAH